MAQVTAVEFIEISLLGIASFDSEKLRLRYKNIIKQAKQMEKAQIIEAFKHGELPPLFVNYNSEQYYNETYNK